MFSFLLFWVSSVLSERVCQTERIFGSDDAQVPASMTSPGGRNILGTVLSEEEGVFYVFHGRYAIGATTFHKEDVWSFDYVRGKYTLIFGDPLRVNFPGTSTEPAARGGAVYALDIEKNRVVMFGGNSKADTWEFFLSNLTWNHLNGAPNTVNPVTPTETLIGFHMFAASCLNRKRRFWYVYGGYCFNRLGTGVEGCDGLWRYGLDTNNWTLMHGTDDLTSKTSSTPGGNRDSSLMCDDANERYFMVGGNRNRDGTVWVFQQNVSEWSLFWESTPGAVSPDPLIHMSLATFEATRNEILVMNENLWAFSIASRRWKMTGTPALNGFAKGVNLEATSNGEVYAFLTGENRAERSDVWFICARGGCRRGEYYDESSGNCSSCSDFSPRHGSGLNRTSCELCSAGKDAEFGECLDCPAGKFSTMQGTVCEKCPPGSETVASGQSFCAIFQKGKTSIAGACVNCSAGTFSNYAGASTCVSCQKGTVAVAGLTLCSACGAGKWADSDICRDCSPGKFAFTEANAQCANCASGTSSLESSSVCTECTAGTFALSQSSFCSICKPGKFSAGAKNSHCSECSGGTYSSSPGQNFCQRCGGTANTTQNAPKTSRQCN